MATIKETALELLKFAQEYDNEVDDVHLAIGVDAVRTNINVYVHMYKQGEHIGCVTTDSIESAKDAIKRHFTPESINIENLEL